MVQFYEKAQPTHDSPFFYLDATFDSGHTDIWMQLKTPYVNTKYFPKTYDILLTSLRSVLNTTCFNEENLPFKKEVRMTEIGHLFEHILLEYLCLEKQKAGYKKVVFNGRTKWNWIMNKYGSFNIFVDAGFKDLQYFIPSLKKAIFLTEKVLKSEINTIYEDYCETNLLLFNTGEFIQEHL